MKADDSFDKWYRKWIARADGLFATARSRYDAGQFHIAKDHYLYASTYYRTSYLPFYGYPVDPWLVDAFEREAEAFAYAAELNEFPLELVDIPFEGKHLKAYWAQPDSTERCRGTILSINDYGSNLYETFCIHGFASVRRGYNFLSVDGPGQGHELIRNRSILHPDWERIITTSIDFLLQKAKIDASAIILAGWVLEQA
ncbi:MAG: hypothetical protein BGO25_11970 [Acidobacteriales bacterium 59-55]|nr:MAG: hypothetical protein BGO25_11970 [Acidobacteriales bacterium 59-55]